MYVSRILYPVEVLGPGKRIGIWMAGCAHHCQGCSNPELWTQKEENQTDIDDVMNLIRLICKTHTVDGFTITGGDPFYQPEALRVLLPRIQGISTDILVYTGFLREELPEDLLRYIAVLIDGKYLEKRNRGEVLRGSDNQRIIVLKDEYKSLYDAYVKTGGGRIQNFATRDGIISVGIHLPGYEEDLRQAAVRRGLEEKRDG